MKTIALAVFVFALWGYISLALITGFFPQWFN